MLSEKENIIGYNPDNLTQADDNTAKPYLVNET
jgi:hypothetical protein